MARYADINKQFQNVNWSGADPDVISFRNELYQKFPQLKVTSAVRTGNGVGKSGSKSRHNRGQALDLAVDKDLHKFLYSAEGDAMLRKYNLGFLDESIEEVRKHTGGTGPHFHIGKDSTLSGNKNKFNTAFKAESSLGQPVDTHDHSHEAEAEEPKPTLYEPPATSEEFFKKIYDEKSAYEADLAQQYEAKKASDARQNAVQQKLKEKLDHQTQMMELIQGHDLESTSRTRSMADGGEFQGLNDNLKFKVDAIKAAMPDFTQVNSEESGLFRELTRVREDLKNFSLAASQTLERERSAPTEVRNDAVSDVVNDAPSDAVNPKLESTNVINKLHNKLSDLGLKSHQIAGVIGSLSGESGINLSATAENPHSKAFGIAQWLGPRLLDLKKFGKERGRDFKNEDIQIEFLLHELQNTSEKKSLTAIKKAKNLEEATMIWTRQFERPSEKEITNSIAVRVKNARMFQNQFS